MEGESCHRNIETWTTSGRNSSSARRSAREAEGLYASKRGWSREIVPRQRYSARFSPGRSGAVLARRRAS